jgi:transcriptional regulator with XRE-family HTH domain
MSRLLGEKLRHLRRYYRLTQTDVAQRLSLATHSHISQLETGNKTPSLSLVLKIADLFGITTDELLRDTITADQLPVRAQPGSLNDQPQIQQLGAKLRYLRTHHGWTQADLSRTLGLAAHAHISYLETNRKEPSIDLLLKIADFFRVTTDYLLRDEIPIELDLSAQDDLS